MSSIKSQLIANIQSYADNLAKASIWNKEPIAHASTSKAVSNFYEFFCYLYLLVDLKQNYVLEYIPGKGGDKHKFPKGPANKKNKPYFTISKGGKVVFQVCYGTKIEIKVPGHFDAPDISFQIPSSPETPTYEHVKVIMDPKMSEKGKVSKGSFMDFVSMIRHLGVEDAELTGIDFHNSELRKIKGNCLITNGKEFKKDAAYHKFHHLSELTFLSWDPSLSPKTVSY